MMASLGTMHYRNKNMRDSYQSFASQSSLIKIDEAGLMIIFHWPRVVDASHPVMNFSPRRSPALLPGMQTRSLPGRIQRTDTLRRKEHASIRFAPCFRKCAQ